MTSTATALPHRNALTVEQRWDIESIFSTDDAWETAFAAVSTRVSEFEHYQGHLADSGNVLLEALQLRDEIGIEVQRVLVYASLRRSEDMTNAHSGAIADQAGALMARYGAAVAFFAPEILAIAPNALDTMIAAAPGLSVYRQYFAQLDRLRGHVRTTEVEALLAEARDVTGSFSTTNRALENADLVLGTLTDEEGRTAILGQGNLQGYLGSQDRAVRQAAWEQSANGYYAMRHTFAGTLTGSVKADVFYARAHGYDTALDATLSPNAIPTSVFHNLLDTVWRNFPTWHRYFAIRRRILGVEQLHGWDLTAPLERTPVPVPFTDAVEMIATGLAPLGEEYVAIVRRGITERWVDRFPNIGKGGGAFSSGVPGTHPFISMNYTDTLGGMSTLAHELGHSLHSHYTWQTQPAVYGRYTMFAAETASNMHQALIGAHLFATHDDPAFLIALIEERMGNFLRYFFTMPILARFELWCHTQIESGNALSADRMCDYLTSLYREGYGAEVAIDAPRMGITWARFSHLYTAYYVFQYATGIAAAAALSQQVMAEGQPAAERYIAFLKKGNGQFPIAAIHEAGIDMTDPAPVQAAFDILAGYVDRLDQLTR